MDKLLEFFSILSDETRLRILILLRKKELCVCEICDILQFSQPKVSRHLAKLRDMGYVRDERQGQWVFYYLNISHQFMSDTLNSIYNSTSQYSVLKEDYEKLEQRIKNGRLCERNE